MKSQDTKEEMAFSYPRSTKKGMARLWQLTGERDIKDEDIVKMLEDRPDQKIWVLDAGCGHGRWSKLLGEKGFEVVGADVSRERVEFGHGNCQVKNVSFMVGSLLDVPVKREAMQVCFCTHVLHHFRDLESVIDELSTVLQGGGEFLIFEPNGSNLVYKLTELGKRFAPRKLMQTKDMDTVNETIHPWQSYVSFLGARGFKNIKVTFLDSGEQAVPFDAKTVMAFLDAYGLTKGVAMSVRLFLFKVASRIPSQSASHDQVVIHSWKN